MNETKWAAVLAVGVLAAGGAVYYFNRSPPPKIEPVAETPPAPAPANTDAPEPHYALPAVAETEQTLLPSLEDSDAVFKDAMNKLFGVGPVEAFLIPELLIRRVVITVDNLSRDRIPALFRPVKRILGTFAVRVDGGRTVLGPDNAARYAPLIGLVKATDAGALVKVYLRYYPLFQKAYRDLGTPDREFNDRLVAAIDNLLATPEPEDGIELVRPKVFYEFADPALEARPAGQKALLRIGAANRAAVKAKLREIRALLVAKSIRP